MDGGGGSVPWPRVMSDGLLGACSAIAFALRRHRLIADAMEGVIFV